MQYLSLKDYQKEIRRKYYEHIRNTWEMQQQQKPETLFEVSITRGELYMISIVLMIVINYMANIFIYF